MAAPRCGRLGQPLELGVVVDQPQRERAAGRDAVVNARFDDDAVGLELLPLAAPVASLAALELAVDRPRVEHDARGKAFDDRRQCRPVRFAGGQVSEHGSRSADVELTFDHRTRIPDG